MARNPLHGRGSEYFSRTNPNDMYYPQSGDYYLDQTGVTGSGMSNPMLPEGYQNNLIELQPDAYRYNPRLPDPRMPSPSYQAMYPRGSRPNEVPSGAGGDGLNDGRERRDLPRNSGNNLMQLAQVNPNTYADQYVDQSMMPQENDRSVWARQPWPMQRGTPGGRAWDMLTRIQPDGRSVRGHHWGEGWPGPHMPLQQGETSPDLMRYRMFVEQYGREPTTDMEIQMIYGDGP